MANRLRLNLKLGEVHEKDYYPIGTHEVVWDGSDSQGNVVASGLYFYQLKAGSFVETRKMLFIR
ncbi:MAG: hypothetical protein ACE1ZS_06320 [Candidatus Poribacteria bacterium]